MPGESDITRRELIRLGALGLAGLITGSEVLADQINRPNGVIPQHGPHFPFQIEPFPSVKWLTFDIVGTVYDWFGSLSSSVPTLGHHYGVPLNGATSATAWIGAYGSGVAAVNGGGPWTPPDQILLDGVYQVFSANHIQPPKSAEAQAFFDLWRQMNPWSHVASGMARLHKRFSLSVLSNMSIATATALKENAGLPFDHFLSGASVDAYKPNPAVYQMAVHDLGMKPSEIMMVAAHKYDLTAAKGQGFHTAFVSRPLEYGPGGSVDTTPDPSFDINSTSFTDLATKLGL